MEDSVVTCLSCGKQNPAHARFCFACGATLSAVTAPGETSEAAPSSGEGDAFSEQETQIPSAPPPKTLPQFTQPAPPPPAPQGYPSPVYPPPYPAAPYPPPKPPRRGRVRCCAIGCLVVLVVLLIGLPILHVTVLRPVIEREIYKQVAKSFEDENQDDETYYGWDTESITERQLNEDIKDKFYVPGSSESHIYLQQDQLKLEVKVYGVNLWAAADLRVNNRGEFVVKSVKLHWLLNVLFSQSGLKREIADTVNAKVVRPRGLYVQAFQVSEGKLFIAYEGR